MTMWTTRSVEFRHVIIDDSLRLLLLYACFFFRFFFFFFFRGASLCGRTRLERRYHHTESADCGLTDDVEIGTHGTRHTSPCAALPSCGVFLTTNCKVLKKWNDMSRMAGKQTGGQREILVVNYLRPSSGTKVYMPGSYFGKDATQIIVVRD